jgi:flagellar biosynthesis GTPase FlhF
MVKNRDRWTIDAVNRDGSVTVAGRSGEIRLPKDYVAEHVELAYAETSHASQGRTVDRSFLLLDGPTGAAGIYVPMTRGRETNEVFVAIRGEETPVDVVSEALSRTWIDRPAIAVRDELSPTVVDDDDDDRVPAQPMPGRELSRCFARFAEVRAEIQSTERHRKDEARERARAAHLQGEARRHLERLQHHLAQSERVLEDLDRPVVRHLHRSELAAARGQVERVSREIEQTEAKARSLEQAARPPSKDSLAELVIAGQQEQRKVELAEIDRQLGRDAVARSTDDAVDAVVLAHVGPAPSNPDARALWDEAAGRLTQHRHAFGVTGTTLLGDKSRVVDDPAFAASWHMASQANDRLARALGRQLTIEPPHRSRGLSR